MANAEFRAVCGHCEAPMLVWCDGEAQRLTLQPLECVACGAIQRLFLPGPVVATRRLELDELADPRD